MERIHSPITCSAPLPDCDIKASPPPDFVSTCHTTHKTVSNIILALRCNKGEIEILTTCHGTLPQKGISYFYDLLYEITELSADESGYSCLYQTKSFISFMFFKQSNSINLWSRLFEWLPLTNTLPITLPYAHKEIIDVFLSPKNLSTFRKKLIEASY